MLILEYGKQAITEAKPRLQAKHNAYHATEPR